MNIIATYENGIDTTKDQAAFEIAKRHDAEFQGSGCWLQKPFLRELEWNVLAEKGKDMAIALRLEGFNVKLGD